MNWFRENPFWGRMALFGGGGFLLALLLLWWTEGNFENAEAQFREDARQRYRLESGNPFPSEASVRKMKTYLANYRVQLDKLKAEMLTHVLPISPLLPNEFQSRLRQAMIATADDARVNRVKLPDSFTLGFDEFSSALPSTADAPRLGRELAQVQLLLKIIIEARVDALTMFRRVAAPASASVKAPSAGPAPAPVLAGPKMVESNAVEFTVAASPSVMRRIVNQIAASNEQFFIIRTLHVKSEQERGPAREITSANVGATPAATAAPGATASPTPAALKFIVGEEHIDFSARVELVNFSY